MISPGTITYLKRMIDRIVRSAETMFIPVPLPASLTNIERSEYTGLTLRKSSSKGSSPKTDILRITGPDAFAVAIHDAIVDYGVLHREVDYNSWLLLHHSGNYKANYHKYNKSHYSDLRGAPVFIIHNINKAKVSPL